MPDFSIIYPDSNSLIKEGWPNISTTLGNLFNLVGRMNLRFALLDPVEQELEAHYLRDFIKTVRETENKAENLTKVMRVLGSKVNLQIPDSEKVRSGYREHVVKLTDRAHVERVSVPLRDVNELFGMAIRHERPFKEKGAGFQDAVICCAAIDHLAASGKKIGAIVTRDGALDAATVAELSQRKGVNLRIFENMESVLSTLFDEYTDKRANELVAEIKADWERAGQAVEKEIPNLEKFVSERLEIPEYSYGDRVLEILNIKVLKVRDARTPLDRKGDGPISISADLDIELKMLVEPGLFSRMPPPKKLKLGVAAEERLSPLFGGAPNALYVSGPEPREQILVKIVSLELQATRTGKEYTEIKPVSMELK